MLKSAITTALALLALRAQEPYFRVSANLVQVDAVVTDSKENHIHNLEATDLQIFEDGRPQQVTRFSRMNGNRTRCFQGNRSGIRRRMAPRSQTARLRRSGSPFLKGFV